MTMDQSEIDITRQLARETVEQLADARRRRKSAEAERDLATVEIRQLLEETEAPFGVAALKDEESELLAMAVETLVDFDKARRAELVAGRECDKFAPPDGVRVDWKQKADVPDANQLPLVFQKVAPKTAEILAALKKGKEVKGATLVILPTVVVTGDAEPEAGGE